VGVPERGQTGSVLLAYRMALGAACVHARIRIDAPAEQVLAKINPTVGLVATADDNHCGMLGLDFHITEPAELVGHLRTLATRYVAATSSPGQPHPHTLENQHMDEIREMRLVLTAHDYEAVLRFYRSGSPSTCPTPPRPPAD